MSAFPADRGLSFVGFNVLGLDFLRMLAAWCEMRNDFRNFHLDRIRGLAIPPAWKDVWICPWPNGHIQATGVDAAGRRQYRYHDQWRARRDAEKHQRVLEISRQLPGDFNVFVAHVNVDLGANTEFAGQIYARLD